MVVPFFSGMDYQGKETMYWHNGGIDGITTQVTLLPEPGICIAILANRSRADGLNDAVRNTILDLLLDQGGDKTDWFDHWLKGTDNGITEMPKVQYYATGVNEWRNAGTWPLENTQYQSYYLHSRGHANTRSGDGTLSTGAPEAEEAVDTYQYDPGHPVPTLGGAICCISEDAAPAGAYDQAGVENRQDVLVYTSDELDGDLEVTGPITATLFVSSSVKDTDFTVKLVDVHPDGTTYNVQDSILRARYREGFGKQVFMQPDGVYRLNIDLHATGNVFLKGHRIRLQVSSSNFPRFVRNLNTGGNNYDETEYVVAENTVHHSAKYPSHIVLPVVIASANARSIDE